MPLVINLGELRRSIEVKKAALSNQAIQEKLGRVRDAYIANLQARLTEKIRPGTRTMESNLTADMGIWRTDGGWAVGIGDMSLLGMPTDAAPRGTIQEFLDWFNRESLAGTPEVVAVEQAMYKEEREKRAAAAAKKAATARKKALREAAREKKVTKPKPPPPKVEPTEEVRKELREIERRRLREMAKEQAMSRAREAYKRLFGYPAPQVEDPTNIILLRNQIELLRRDLVLEARLKAQTQASTASGVIKDILMRGHNERMERKRAQIESIKELIRLSEE